MIQFIRGALLAFIVAFLLPVAAAAAWWSTVDRPGSWRSADWTSSGTLPPPATDDAAIYLMAARTGGLKGALSVHSWIVLKRPGEAEYVRYDKVGWGRPVRRNAYAADANWYSNSPDIVHAVRGDRAIDLIGDVEAAIEGYPYADPGSYRIWPGPNSNSFVAHVVDAVPQLGASMPPNATGRDFAPGIINMRLSADWLDVHVTLAGLAGFAIGRRSGAEVHLLGAVVGVDILRPALKLPAIGRVDLAF